MEGQKERETEREIERLANGKTVPVERWRMPWLQLQKECISNTLSIWRHVRQNVDFEGSKKVQKSGFKIDREPADTVPKQTSSMFFSDPEKSMCQKTKATKHVSTPL